MQVPSAQGGWLMYPMLAEMGMMLIYYASIMLRIMLRIMLYYASIMLYYASGCYIMLADAGGCWWMLVDAG